MKKISIKSFYRVLAILTMGNLTLPIIFENIFFPFSSTLFFQLAWIGSLLLFYPKIFLSKAVFYIFLFFMLYLLLMHANIYNIDILWLKGELVPILFSIIILQYFKLSGDFKGLFLVLKVTFIFVIITLITTIIGLQQYPTAARDLAGRLAWEEKYIVIAFYKSIGIASYGFFYGISLTFPLFMSLLKMKHLNKKYKVYIFILTLIALLGLIMSQFTTALLLAITGSLLALWSLKKSKRTIIIFIFIIVFIVHYSSTSIADIILYFSNILPGDILQHRLNDLSISLSEGVGKAGTHIDTRANRIPFLINSFIKSPIIGGGETTGHVFWLDRLSMFGILGIIPWFLIIHNQIKNNMRLLDDLDKIYYLISMLLFIGMGIIKGMGGTLMLIFVFFIFPSILLVKKNLPQLLTKHAYSSMIS